jgi:hypothetical protein
MMKVKLQRQNLDDVLNVDQTPILYSYHATKTLIVKGQKTFHARASMLDTKHVTLAATIDTSGKLLTSFLIQR